MTAGWAESCPTLDFPQLNNAYAKGGFNGGTPTLRGLGVSFQVLGVAVEKENLNQALASTRGGLHPQVTVRFSRIPQSR